MMLINFTASQKACGVFQFIVTDRQGNVTDSEFLAELVSQNLEISSVSCCILLASRLIRAACLWLSVFGKARE